MLLKYHYGCWIESGLSGVSIKEVKSRRGGMKASWVTVKEEMVKVLRFMTALDVDPSGLAGECNGSGNWGRT